MSLKSDIASVVDGVLSAREEIPVSEQRSFPGIAGPICTLNSSINALLEVIYEKQEDLMKEQAFHLLANSIEFSAIFHTSQGLQLVLMEPSIFKDDASILCKLGYAMRYAGDILANSNITDSIQSTKRFLCSSNILKVSSDICVEIFDGWPEIKRYMDEKGLHLKP